jgi:ribonuclease HI
MTNCFGLAQINLQHGKAATAFLCRTLAEMQTNIYLIQEPYFHKGIKGLDSKWGRVICGDGESRKRACLYINNCIDAVQLPQFSNNDMATAIVTVDRKDLKVKFICCSLYLAYDEDPCSPLLLDLLSFSRVENIPILIGMDANAHHVIWGSTDTNSRGESVMDLICSNNLFILNDGNAPTFANSVRQEVIDITVCSMDLVSEISNWRVWDEESLSDHKYIRFDLGWYHVRPRCFRNPKNTFWDQYRSKLSENLTDWICPTLDLFSLENASNKITSAILESYRSSCPLNLTSFNSNGRPFSGRLLHLRRQVRRQWNRRSSNPDSYNKALREFKKELKKDEDDRLKSFCSRVNSLSAVSKLQKMFIGSSTSQIGSLRKPNGEIVYNEAKVLDLLMSTHFPLCRERNDESIAYNEINRICSRQTFEECLRIFTPGVIRWSILSFERFKSPGKDGIFPALLSEGIDYLVEPLQRLFSLSLALGHVPKAWSSVRISFIPKPARPSYLEPKSFRPISLSSFILKTMEKILDFHLRKTCKVGAIMHFDQHAYLSGRSTVTALHSLSTFVDKTMNFSEFAAAAFIDVEGAFDNTSFDTIARAMRIFAIPETIIEWVMNMLSSRILTAELRDCVSNKVPSRGCPQGGVLSPLLWIMVANSLMVKLSSMRFKVIGYADDFVIVARGICLATVLDRLQNSLKAVEDWCCETSLNVNPSKTSLLFFTKRRITVNNKTLKLFGTQIPFSSKVKYLGVTFDSKLSWSHHFEERVEKACIVFGQCRRFFGLRWGLRPKYVHWLYTMVVLPYLTYGCSVWWQRCGVIAVQTKLSHLQRMACLGITGAMRTTPTAAMEVMLNLPPLHFFIRKCARLTLNRIRVAGFQPCPSSSDERSWNKLVAEIPLLMSPQDNILRVLDAEKNFNALFLSDTFTLEHLNGLGHVVYTDGSVTNHGAGAGVFSSSLQLNLSVALGICCSVYQAEIYSIILALKKLSELGLLNSRIVICTDSQLAIHSLQSYKIDSALTLECLALMREFSEPLTIVWVPSHSGVPGNETADHLARLGSAKKFVGPEPCLGLDRHYFKKQTNQWLLREHVNHWQSLTSCRDAKLYFVTPNVSVSKYLLNLDRSKLSSLVRALSGHCRFNYHMSKLGLASNPLCPQCESDADTPYHLICLCPYYALVRFEKFGKHVLDQYEFANLKIGDILWFILNSNRSF